uniref:Ig-like domain-containing protein n=1 Tax=Salmo trutta TaxID=8032 RepID=A0A674F4A5_SALTR
RTYLMPCTGDHIQHQQGSVIATEGGLVTLSCQYNTSANNDAYLYWFKQEANDFPKHMLSRYSIGSGDNTAGFKERFNASLNAKTQSVPLTIQRLQLSDSAVYYCALRPTVTTRYTAPLQKHCVCTWVCTVLCVVCPLTLC